VGEWRPSRPGERRGGRKIGTPNKTTRSIREAFVEAFDELGGAPALARWGRENPNLFYPLASKLIPTEITGANGSPLVGVVVLPALGAPSSSPDALSALRQGDGASALPIPSAGRLGALEAIPATDYKILADTDDNVDA
jgi:hypothetical protein